MDWSVIQAIARGIADWGNKVSQPTKFAPAGNGGPVTIDLRYAAPKLPVAPEENCMSAVGCEFGCRCHLSDGGEPDRSPEKNLATPVGLEPTGAIYQRKRDV
jgi:hypothetical protein